MYSNNFTESMEQAKQFIAIRSRRPIRTLNYSLQSIQKHPNEKVEKNKVVEYHDIRDEQPNNGENGLFLFQVICFSFNFLLRLNKLITFFFY